MKSRLRGLLALVLMLSSGALMGCAITPWVKHHERHYLAEPIMRLDCEAATTGFMNAVYRSREAARGAAFGGGSGQGCH